MARGASRIRPGFLKPDANALEVPYDRTPASARMQRTISNFTLVGWAAAAPAACWTDALLRLSLWRRGTHHRQLLGGLRGRHLPLPIGILRPLTYPRRSGRCAPATPRLIEANPCSIDRAAEGFDVSRPSCASSTTGDQADHRRRSYVVASGEARIWRSRITLMCAKGVFACKEGVCVWSNVQKGRTDEEDACHATVAPTNRLRRRRMPCGRVAVVIRFERAEGAEA